VATETSPGVFTTKYSTRYGYDPAGNVTSMAGATNGTADQGECFQYDYLRRMSQAWTLISGACATPQATGADPFWRTWTFDSTGNRLIQTDKDSVAGDTNWTYQVGSASGVTAHQLKQVTATGRKSGTPTRTFGHDLAGNLTSRTSATSSAQTLT
jgi:YD repeat-containing protein